MKVNTVGYFEIQSSNPERDKQFYASLGQGYFLDQDNNTF